MNNKEIIQLCISELWQSVNTPQFFSDYQEYQIARALQRLHRKFVHGTKPCTYTKEENIH